MKNPEIHISKLRESFGVFKRMIEREDKVPVTSIKESAYFKKNEMYKDRISEDVRRKMDAGGWSSDTFGSGQILQSILGSIDVKVNNLLDWRSMDYLKKLKENPEALEKYERLFYELYKNKKMPDEEIFKELKALREDYRLITYLFFIKNERKYLPLSPANFDRVFEKMGVEYRASHKCSWVNYRQFRDLVGQVQSFLRRELPEDDISLLDAHSYLWLLKMELEQKKWVDRGPELESVLKALREFSSEYPDTNDYQNWLEDPHFMYALVWEETLFPPKEIHARVMGKSRHQFSSGEKTTNRYFKSLGFRIIPKDEAKFNLWKERLENDEQAGRDTDGKCWGTIRLEQSFLREKLLGNHREAPCGLCGEVLPKDLLIAAHIKRRCDCTREEKLDFKFVAMLMCSLGCDAVYEKKYVSVEDGRVVIICDVRNLAPKIRNYLIALDGRKSIYWKAEMKKYFDWHYQQACLKNKT